MRRPDLLRDDGSRHRQGTLGRGQVARPFPRRVRRVLRPGPDRRGRSAGADLADAQPLRLDLPAAPGRPARRQCDLGTSDPLGRVLANGYERPLPTPKRSSTGRLRGCKELKNDDERRTEFIDDYEDEAWGEDAPKQS